MDSYQKNKERSLERSNASSPKTKRLKREEPVPTPSPERIPKTEKEKPVPEDCLKCSKGFFFWFLKSNHPPHL